VSVYVSYAREDTEVADLLRQDIERADRQVWIDRALIGGQKWWEAVLLQIRKCDLFVFALSPDSLRSETCTAELHYALALRRPLLPVLVRDTSLQLAPPEISNLQIVDYRQRMPDTASNLANAMLAAPLPPQLPNPLPPPPLRPTSHMDTYREKVLSSSMLSSQEQTALVLELRDHLQDDDGRDLAVGLLQRLRNRPDITASVVKDIDMLLANLPPVSPVELPRQPAAPGVTRVFISYRREDSIAMAGRIRDQLAARFGADNVFFDIDTIPLGVDFRQHIDKMVADCDVVLVIIGRRWLDVTDSAELRRLDQPGDFVRLEVEAALRRGIPVVPVLVDGASVPNESKLPSSLAELSYRNGLAVRYDPDFHPDMERLMRGLGLRS
jgi:hypothetical protein